jgi:hypothetical protein
MNAKFELLLLALATLIAGIILRVGFSGERRFEEAALGTLTTGYEAKGPTDLAIHTVKQKPIEINQMLASVSPEKETIFFLGNSQTHSINQWEKGQVNYPQLLAKSTDRFNILCNSLPNATLQEFYLIAMWWMTQVPIDQLVIPVFMDDLREDGLRSDFIPAILDTGYELPEDGGPLEKKIASDLLALRMPQETAVEGGNVSKKQTPQDYVEQELNNFLSANFEVWRNRPNARGDLFMQLYQWRNAIFGITASSKRKMIPNRYAANLEALDLLLEKCSTQGIQTIVYIPPIRTDVEVPYDLTDYSNFREDIERIALAHNSQFLNLENIVPGPLWGMKASTTGDDEPELDFMHFQAEGHRILADALAPYTIEVP